MKIVPLIVSFFVAVPRQLARPVLHEYGRAGEVERRSRGRRALVDPAVGPSRRWAGRTSAACRSSVWHSEFGPIEAFRYQKPITLGWSASVTGRWPIDGVRRAAGQLRDRDDSRVGIDVCPSTVPPDVVASAPARRRAASSLFCARADALDVDLARGCRSGCSTCPIWFCGFVSQRSRPTATLFGALGAGAFAGIVSPIVAVCSRSRFPVRVDGRRDGDRLLEA